MGENGAELSFAGLHSARLDVVGGAAVLAAVEECIASQGSQRASGPARDRQRAHDRRERWRVAQALYLPHVIRSDDLEAIGRPPEGVPENARELRGTCLSRGTARHATRTLPAGQEITLFADEGRVEILDPAAGC